MTGTMTSTMIFTAMMMMMISLAAMMMTISLAAMTMILMDLTMISGNTGSMEE